VRAIHFLKRTNGLCGGPNGRVKNEFGADVFGGRRSGSGYDKYYLYVYLGGNFEIFGEKEHFALQIVCQTINRKRSITRIRLTTTITDEFSESFGILRESEKSYCLLVTQLDTVGTWPINVFNTLTYGIDVPQGFGFAVDHSRLGRYGIVVYFVLLFAI